MNSPAEAPGAPKSWHKGLVALLAVAFFLYPYLLGRQTSPETRGAELVGDGYVLVTQHPVLRDAQAKGGVAPIGEALKTTWWGPITAGQALYRPIPMALLAAAGSLGEPYMESAPKDAPFPYHLFVLALNALCALLVYELAWLVLKSDKAALVAGALFATLPIHGEVIFDVAGVAELSAAAFSLAAWIAWIRAGDSPLAKPAQLAIALLCLFLATLCKESAFGLPLVFFLFDLRLGKDGGLAQGFSRALAKLPALVLCGLVLGASAWLRHGVTGELRPTYVAEHGLDNPLLFQSAAVRVMNALRVLAMGTASVFGVNLMSANWNYSPDYSYNQIPVLPAFSPSNLLGLAAVGGALAVAAVLYRRCRTRAALVFAFLGATLLTSNLLFPIGTIFGDRLMFFPSAVAVLFAAAFLARAGLPGTVLGLALALGGGAWTWWHGKEHWMTASDLWNYAAVEAVPSSARARFQNAIDARNDQVYGLARKELERALEIRPDYAQAMSLLGDLHMLPQEHDPERALELWRKACETQLESAGWRYGSEPLITETSFGPRALLFRTTGVRVFAPVEELHDPAEHLQWLDSLRERGYDSAYLHHKRAETLVALGRAAEAEAEFERSIEMEPTRDGIQAFGKFLQDQGRAQEALTLYDTLTDFATPGERVAVLLSRAEASFVEGPDKVEALADQLWSMRDELAREGKYLFTPEEEFRTLSLRARARLLRYGPNATQEQLEEVIQVLQNACGAWRVHNQQTLDALMLLVQLMITAHQDEEARPLLESLVFGQESRGGTTAEVPPSLRLLLGQVYARLGRYQDALEQFEKIDANLVQAAQAFGAEGDASFRKVLLDTRRLVLDMHSLLGQESQAYAAIDEWHVRAPGGTDPDALVVQTYWELSRGRAELALEAARTLLQEFPEDERGPAIQDNLVKIQALERVVREGSDPAKAEELAVLRRQLGDTPGAIEAAERAVELTPESAPLEAARRLALVAACQEQAGDLPAAKAAVDRALELELPATERTAYEAERARLARP